VPEKPDRCPDLIASLQARLGTGRVMTDAAERWAYGYDNSRRQTLPAAVVMVEDHDDVLLAVRACHEHKVPLTVRGRGTGTAGAAVPSEHGIVLSTERMSRILSIDPDNRVAVVQPGVINGDLQREAARQGFFWPPDPTSADYCSIGGNLGCNSAGPRAVKYGTPRENTLGLRAVTGDGRSLRTGCYTTKGVVGYDLTRLLIGSEGTLAVITEATLKLTPLPEAIATLRALYRDMATAAAAVSRIMARPVLPRSLEFMDGAAIGLVRGCGAPGLPQDAGAMLLIEVDGAAGTLQLAADAVRDAAAGEGLISVETAHDQAEVAALWASRKALSPALRAIAPKKINEDVVVPVSRMAELITALEAMAGEYGVTIVSFGHAGNGNIHVNILGDPAVPGESERMRACMEAMFRKVLDLGGTLSGEHGIGFEKRDAVALEIEPETLGLMRRIKQNFDPRGILNPGKMFPDTPESI
jgi:D-lactate dehydrogenase